MSLTNTFVNRRAAVPQDQDMLINAARDGHTAIVERLLAAEGIDVNGVDEEGDTALILAADQGHTDIVELLLAVPGIDVNANPGETALIVAASEGHTDIAELLLAVPGINVNAEDDEGATALTWAAEYSAAIVELLLDHPDIDVSDAAFIRAAEYGRMAIIRYRMLHDHPGIDVSNEALIHAARNGNTAIVELLLAVPGIDLNALDNEYGWTALTGAASDGNTAIVELLLAAGADVNAKDRYGATALMKAASRGHTAIVELLLAVPGIDVNVVDKPPPAGNGYTALIAAARRGHTAVVRAIERFIAEQAMNRWIPRHRGRVRDRVGFGEFVRSTRVRRRRRNSAGDVEEYEIDRLPKRAQTFIKGFL